MAEPANQTKPEFRNIGLAQLAKYRLPMAGKVSILHRLSGALLFLLLPVALYIFDQSLHSAPGFEHIKGFFGHLGVKLVLLVLAWAFVFHFCAGIRFLLLDTHRFGDKKGSHHTATSVLVGSSVITLAIALKLFGAF